MTAKTLGQVARDTFGNATGPTIADDWEAAAEDVVKHYLATETEAPLDIVKRYHEAYAVIEAAEAWIDRRDGPTDEQLRLTVAALQEARDEV